MAASETPPRYLFTLCIVRHGETTANKAGIIQGQSLDPSYALTPLGESQATTGGKAWSSRRWWRVYSSDLPRAIQTTEFILAEAEDRDGLPGHVTDALLRECAAGARQGMRIGMKEKEAKQEWAKQGLEPPPRETVADMATRGQAFVERVAKELRDSEGGGQGGSSRNEAGEARKELLVVSHGGFIKVFLCAVCGAEEVEEVRNTSMSEVDVYDLASGELGYDIRRISDTAHLPEDLESESKW
mmetsp:Transcript_32771/g.86658  ORF Transcript_32771/g.86658 Transcript_32771/m.86658 type:complete len:243 (-) Transcript_32771:744-1472(-)